MSPHRSSRQRYRAFRQDYRQGRLADEPQANGKQGPPHDAHANGDTPSTAASQPAGKRREHLRSYVAWLWPHRYAVGIFFLLALLAAGLQMVEPLFMRYTIDRVLLNSTLDRASRLTRLHVAGAVFLGVILLSNVVGVLKDYRQRLLNIRVMLSLRRSLFKRLLYLPLPKLWDMKTGEFSPA